MAGFHTMWLNLPHMNDNSGEFSLPGFPSDHKFKTKNLPESLQETKTPWEFGLEMFRSWQETGAMFFNTVEAIDRTGLTYFGQQFPNCWVYAIGPIISSIGSKAWGGEEAEATRNLCTKWLDSKPQNSVLYVSFGSQSSPSEEQTAELAKALDASNINFLWVIRPPSTFLTDSVDNKTKKDWLPSGFEERSTSSGKGLLLKKWPPQLEIVYHKLVAVFLSHCGWNSTIEALSNGVSMLSWTMSAEQPFNGQFLEEEIGVCLSVANGTSSEVKYEEVVKKIELVMKEKKGNVMRRKACGIINLIGSETNDQEIHNSSSIKAMDDFLNEIVRMR